MSSLLDLPIEVLFEIQLLSASEHLPILNRHTRSLFQHASNHHKMRYLYLKLCALTSTEEHLTEILCFPLITLDLFKMYKRFISDLLPESCILNTSSSGHLYCDGLVLPRRFFRHLNAPGTTISSTTFSFITELVDRHFFGVNNDCGYALARATKAESVPLLTFLLSRGANPACNASVIMPIAIKSQNVDIFELLFRQLTWTEHMDKDKELSDMLELAGKKGVWSIFDRLLAAGAQPNLKTVLLLNKRRKRKGIRKGGN